MDSFFNTLGVFELHLLDYIQNNFTSPFMDAFMTFMSTIGNYGLIWIILSIMLMLFKTTRKSGVVMAISLVLGLLACNLIMKPVFARMRPFDLAQFSVIIKAPDDYSFPSGHTLASFEAFWVLVLTKAKKYYSIIILFIATLISFSRLYLYVHFPSDVIVSIILGFISAFLALRLTEACINSKLTHK